MSKKSRKRNKRLLMLAALAGGAAFLGRGKKKFGTDAGFLKSGAAGGASLRTPLVDADDMAISTKKPPIIRKDVLPIKKNQYVPVDKTLAQEKAGKFIENLAPSKRKLGSSYQVTENMMRPANIPFTPAFGGKKLPMTKNPAAIDLINKMNKMSKIHMQAKGGRVGANKGGSVTGAAKRGFGRALKKK